MPAHSLLRAGGDRVDAGRQLAQRLKPFQGQNIVVVGLPRGGVPVAFEVAKALQAPLDVLVVRKLGVPYQPELAMGAIGEGGIRVVNREVVRPARVTEHDGDHVGVLQRGGVLDEEHGVFGQRAVAFGGVLLLRRPSVLSWSAPSLGRRERPAQL